MRHLEQVFTLRERLADKARGLKLSYNCELKILVYNKAETRVEDGETYAYPETFDINIENWSTWKGSFRISDGRFIREGMDLNGPGLSVLQLYKRMLKMLRAHAAVIRLHDEAAETNSVVFGDSLVVVENADARELGPERVFVIVNDEGGESRWYGRSADDALSNAYPWIKNQTPVLMRLEAVQGE